MNYCAWSAVFRVRINFKRIRILHFLYLTYLTCFNDFFNFFVLQPVLWSLSILAQLRLQIVKMAAPAPASQDGGSGYSSSSSPIVHNLLPNFFFFTKGGENQWPGGAYV